MYIRIGPVRNAEGETTVSVSKVAARWWYPFVEWIAWPMQLHLFFSKHGLYSKRLTEVEMAEIGPVWYTTGGMTWSID